MSWQSKWLRGLFALLAAVSASSSAAAEDAPAFRIWIATPDVALALRRAALAAHRKLQDPRCREVFSDFTDAAGSTLQRNLDALGLTPAQYLTFVVFMDAHQLKANASTRCQKVGTLAVAQPGGRVVGVCSEKVVRAVAEQGGENLLIHEMLHTLGLGENPPTGAEIDAVVVRRCGR
jgi:hypothetical protein